MSHDALDMAMDTATDAAADPLSPTRMDMGAGAVTPESPLPQPVPDWLHQAGNVEVQSPDSLGFGARSRPPRAEPLRSGNPPTRSFASRRTLRAATAAGIVGIAVMGYLYISKDSFSVIDMLGSELVKLVPESAPVNRGPIAPIDPRLADPVALEFQRLETVSPSIAAQAATPPTSLPAVTELDSLDATSPGHPEVAPAPAPVPQPMPTAVAPAVSAAAPGVTNEELMLRLQKLELLLAQLQMQAQATGQPPSVAKAAPAAAPAVGTTTAPAASAAPAPRPAAARMTKAVPPKHAQHAKAAAPAKPTASAAVPATALGGQLVSVDMWNGEASVVISSGLPGDRRVRVLRPGDVVNGLALRSADPVTRSATFAAPGSQGLTLYVSQGG